METHTHTHLFGPKLTTREQRLMFQTFPASAGEALTQAAREQEITREIADPAHNAEAINARIRAFVGSNQLRLDQVGRLNAGLQARRQADQALAAIRAETTGAIFLGIREKIQTPIIIPLTPAAREARIQEGVTEGTAFINAQYDKIRSLIALPVAPAPGFVGPIAPILRPYNWMEQVRACHANIAVAAALDARIVGVPTDPALRATYEGIGQSNLGSIDTDQTSFMTELSLRINQLRGARLSTDPDRATQIANAEAQLKAILDSRKTAILTKINDLATPSLPTNGGRDTNAHVQVARLLEHINTIDAAVRAVNAPPVTPPAGPVTPPVTPPAIAPGAPTVAPTLTEDPTMLLGRLNVTPALRDSVVNAADAAAMATALAALNAYLTSRPTTPADREQCRLALNALLARRTPATTLRVAVNAAGQLIVETGTAARPPERAPETAAERFATDIVGMIRKVCDMLNVNPTDLLGLLGIKTPAAGRSATDSKPATAPKTDGRRAPARRSERSPERGEPRSASALLDRADELRDEADELERSGGRLAREIRTQVAALRRQADALEARARQMMEGSRRTVDRFNTDPRCRQYAVRAEIDPRCQYVVFSGSQANQSSRQMVNRVCQYTGVSPMINPNNQQQFFAQIPMTPQTSQNITNIMNYGTVNVNNNTVVAPPNGTRPNGSRG